MRLLTPVIIILLTLGYFSDGSRLFGDQEHSTNRKQIVRLKLSKPWVKIAIQNNFELLDYRLEQTFAANPANESSNSSFRTKLSNFEHLNYYARVWVGNPARSYTVLIDTASTDFWLTSAKCKSELCMRKNTYDGEESQDHISEGRNVSIAYVNMIWIAGQLCFDSFQLGDWNIKQQPIIEAIELIGDALLELPLDGVLGFGLSQSSAGMNVKNPIRTMLDQDHLAEPIFSFSLNHQIDSHEAGELILGGSDANLYRGEVTWAPLIKADQWVIRLDSIKLQFNDNYDATNNDSSSASTNRSTSVGCINGCQASVDTGTFMIVGHSDAATKLNMQLGGRHIGRGNFQLINCDLSRLPNLIFTISGKEFKLKPDLYVAQLAQGCISLIKAMDIGGSKWILGDRFIGNYYTIFDYGTKRIGFAESIHQRSPMTS